MFDDAIESYKRQQILIQKILMLGLDCLLIKFLLIIFINLRLKIFGHEQKAIFYADKMIEVAPNSPRSYNLRANIDRKDSNFEEAKKFIKKLWIFAMKLVIGKANNSSCWGT